MKKKSRHLFVVSAFIVAASFLVVLTTFAINMLTSTGEFNRLLVNWTSINSNSNQWAQHYLETGNDQFLMQYRDAKQSRVETGNVVDELMVDDPKEEVIFNEFQFERIHPNELSGLIRIFTLFKNSTEVVQLKETWKQVQQMTSKKDMAVDSLIAVKQQSNLESAEEAVLSIYNINEEINREINGMITKNSGVLLLLKRYSLWFTVLLGILIVLIGIIFTVRGTKQINQTKKLLRERDYLALFPELNQFPVLNVSPAGELRFVNNSARKLFSSIHEQGIHHPFLKKLKSELSNISDKWGTSTVKEVRMGKHFYQQAINFISEEKGIHVHSIDITPLKEEQFKLSKSLEEKNLLLAEIHHRVKNNMAVISGLLELQEMLGETPETALTESRSRIQSMAIVHELLYQSDSFSNIDALEYLEKMANHLQMTFDEFNNVENEVLFKKGTININLAVPLGLLINELGYYISSLVPENKRSVCISLSMTKNEDQFCLHVKATIPDVQLGIDKEQISNLRKNLIKNLLKQIDGQLLFPESETFYMKIIFDSSIKKGSNSAYL